MNHFKTVPLKIVVEEFGGKDKLLFEWWKFGFGYSELMLRKKSKYFIAE